MHRVFPVFYIVHQGNTDVVLKWTTRETQPLSYLQQYRMEPRNCSTELQTDKDLTELTQKEPHEPPFTRKLYILFSSSVNLFGKKKSFLIEYIHIFKRQQQSLELHYTKILL